MISVIVPAYNLENYIARTLDSILTQTYKDIEIVIVDDGSTDSTGEIIDKYSEKYPSIKVFHIENSGVTNARLTGIANACGDWIGFCDGDDYIEPDMYEHLMSNAVEFDADISHCGYRMVFVDGRVNYFYDTGRLVHQDKLTGLKDLLDGSFVEPGLCNKLFNKKVFHSLLHDDVMDKDVKNNEDLLMNFILFSSAEKSIYEDFCPYHYIVRNNSASRAKLNKHKIYDPIKVREDILNLSSDDVIPFAEKNYIGTCINAYNTLVCDKSKGFSNDKMIIRNLIKTNKSMIALLDKRQKLSAKMILSFPSMYTFAYRVYTKHFQKNLYS